ncbi:MAG TPA: HAD hydrolase family protein [Terriglobia bacterium]|nr:HAD hydrolase family protein [Terriglobia bacterium]
MRRSSSNRSISGVFTDLDGTLLDRDTYRWTQARPALDALRRRGIPLVIVTSKTTSEVWPLLRGLHRRDPFAVENGGAIFVPARYFPFVIPGTHPARPGWRELVLGTPRPRLVRALDRAAALAGARVRGFSQMSVPEVIDLTGLRLSEARAAMRRQYDEPFVILDRRADAWPRLRREIRHLGFDATRGTRLFHITGRSDKGAAILRLIKWFLRAARASSAVGRAGSVADARAAVALPGITVGLGDSPNDIPLLRAVYLPIIVAGAGGRYDAETLAAVPKARRAGGAGPMGWNRSILGLLPR